jgi:threonine dehydrogenase-like Zn-dependent dehydrogenase
MQALTFHGPRDVRLEDKPRPELLEPTDVILRVTTAAVCGTDLHFFHGKEPGIAPGTTLGHEFVGVVEEAGPAVRSIEVGKRYASSMLTACGTCPACFRHDWRNCGHFALFGMGDAFGGLDGGQAEYVRVPLADLTLAEIPPLLSDEDVILTTDVLATAYTAMVKAGVGHGDTVAIIGAGTVGQLCVMCARLFGASKVFAVDLLPERLKEAEALGAIPVNAGEVDPSDVIAEHTGNLGADIVVEAVGAQPALDTAWSVARTGATLALVGFLLDEDWPVTCGDSWLRALTVHPVLGDPITHRHQLLRLIESGHLEPKRVISNTMALDEAVEAYRLFDAREASKILLKPNPDAPLR